LVRGVLRALGWEGPVKSPTYSLVEYYPFSSLYLYHFDFYRFADPREWETAGLSDSFRDDSACLVEWPERVAGLLPPPDVALTLAYPSAQPGRRLDAARELEKILNHLDKNEPRLDLPLDIRATAFQRQVWEKLRTIPYGETVSYAEVAKALGKRGAVRAVGRACATNPVALVIPCHRVVREDQSLGGYRWGLERKKKLLERERRAEKP
jgi:tRNA threonylcarbamoyl adenosine modification protein YjeE